MFSFHLLQHDYLNSDVWMYKCVCLCVSLYELYIHKLSLMGCNGYLYAIVQKCSKIIIITYQNDLDFERTTQLAWLARWHPFAPKTTPGESPGTTRYPGDPMWSLRFWGCCGHLGDCEAVCPANQWHIVFSASCGRSGCRIITWYIQAASNYRYICHENLSLVMRPTAMQFNAMSCHVYNVM